MKTQVKKRSENQTGEFMMLAVYFVILAGLFLVTENFSEFKPWPQPVEKTSAEISTFALIPNQQSATTVNKPDLSVELLNDYLAPAEENEFPLSTVKSFQFPGEKMSETHSGPVKNEYLLMLAKEKNDELAEYYNLVAKVKEYLADEVEKPLELENWMTDEACWCSDPAETFLTKK